MQYAPNNTEILHKSRLIDFAFSHKKSSYIAVNSKPCFAQKE